MAKSKENNGKSVKTPRVGDAPKPPKASDIKKARTRLRILNAARKIFAKKGFDSANVSDIVASIKVAQGTFYYHFPDKKSVLMEMLEGFFAQMRQLAADWARTTEIGPEAAASFSGAVATLLYENRDLARIVLNEGNNTDPEIRGLVSDFYQYMYQQTALALDLGMRLGVVRKLDSGIASVALIGMIEEVVIDQLKRKGPMDLNHVIKEISDLQNYGIRPR